MAEKVEIKFYKIDNITQATTKNSLFAVKADNENSFKLYVTDLDGNLIPLFTSSGTGGGITNLTSTDSSILITGSAVKDLKISTTLKNLINSALQSGSNISELINDSNFITLSDVPVFVPSDYDLEDFTNNSIDPFVRQSEVGTGSGANLAYTASPTQGTVTSDSGTDAIIPLADNTNAGLINSAEKSKIATAIQPADLGVVATSNDYNDLDNIPTTFSPSAHTHVEADITDLDKYTQSEVDTFLSNINTDAIYKDTVKLSENISKGQAVYVSGANGTNILVSKASNATEATSSKTLGLLETTGVTNDIVKVVTNGLLSGLNTNSATIGDPVWLGTSGNLIYGLANKPVAPAHLVYIGVVTRVSATVGEIFVKIQNGFELNEIHDVLLTSLTNNDVLQYETSSGLWKNKQIISNTITNGVTDKAPSEDTIFDALTFKQDTLVSATNIKTINGNSILGSGDLVISGGSNIQIATQTSNITTNTTTMINTTMSFNLAADSVYIVEGYFYGGCSSGGGMRFGWSGLPVDVTGIHSVISANLTAFSNSPSSVTGIGTIISGFAIASNIQQTRYVATIITGGSGGTITAQVATATAGQTTIFRTFSNLKITKG